MNRRILGFHRRVWCPKWTPGGWTWPRARPDDRGCGARHGVRGAGPLRLKKRASTAESPHCATSSWRASSIHSLHGVQSLAVQRAPCVSFRPLPNTRTSPLVKVDTVEIEVAKLRDPKARAVEQLAHRPVKNVAHSSSPQSSSKQRCPVARAPRSSGRSMGGLGRQHRRCRGVALDQVTPLEEARRSSCGARPAGGRTETFVRRRGWSCRPSSRATFARSPWPDRRPRCRWPTPRKPRCRRGRPVGSPRRGPTRAASSGSPSGATRPWPDHRSSLEARPKASNDHEIDRCFR
jgi:hypothetical protein